MNITKEEFLQAVDVIERYQKQLNEQINLSKTPIKLWEPYMNGGLPIRVRQALNHIIEHPFEYLEDVTKIRFLQTRNVGIDSWNEFVKLRGY